MNHGQDRVARKHFVHSYKLRDSGARRNRGRRISSGEDWTKVNDSTDGDCRANEREKNYCAPQYPAGTISWLHTVYYAPLV
jgi:hypothetical protein